MYEVVLINLKLFCIQKCRDYFSHTGVIKVFGSVHLITSLL